MFIETHCHLDFPEYDSDRADVIQRSKQAQVIAIINIGSSLEGSQKGLDLAGQYDFIYASVGIHPHDADKAGKGVIQKIDQLTRQPKVVSIGEIGLDYFRNLSSPVNQKKLFEALLDLAKTRSLPVIIHCRQAYEDTLAILKKKRASCGVVHCFSGDEAFLRQCLDLGLHISFTCNLTYKKADNLRQIAKLVPSERLLLETDAPFLPPEGFRGKRNEPMYLKYLAEELARIKSVSLEEIAEVTTHNAKKLFKLNV